MSPALRTVMINQPSLFAWFGEFQKLQLCDLSICLDHVDVQKAGFLCRARIRAADDRLTWLTVPSRASTRSGSICDVALLPTEEWMPSAMSKLWHAYRTAPHRDDLLLLLEETAAGDHEYAVDLAERSLEVVADYLHFPLPPRVRSSRMTCRAPSTALIAGLSSEVGATQYVYGPGSSGGPHYLDLQLLRGAGIEPRVVHYHDAATGRSDSQRVARTSMLDLIARHGTGALRAVEPAE
jgi:hypothetical protein